MITTQLKLTPVLVAILLTVSMAAKAIGSLQPPNPALRGFIEGCEDKPQPCWYGILPLVTTANEAAAILNTRTYKIERPEQQQGQVMFATSDTQCNLDIALDSLGQQVVFLFVSGECDLRLGDVVATLGLPDFVNRGDLYSWNTPPMLFYANGTRLWLDSCCGFSLYAHFRFIDLQSYGEAVRPPLKWRGFIPNLRYCQLEPEIMEC